MKDELPWFFTAILAFAIGGEFVSRVLRLIRRAVWNRALRRDQSGATITGTFPRIKVTFGRVSFRNLVHHGAKGGESWSSTYTAELGPGLRAKSFAFARVRRLLRRPAFEVTSADELLHELLLELVSAGLHFEFAEGRFRASAGRAHGPGTAFANLRLIQRVLQRADAISAPDHRVRLAAER